jgi:UDP-N-acetyl-D-mannosaminuronic acid transferase (WecB/TagA/CpsF family)
MVLMWRLLGQEWLPRVSGLEYLRRLLRTPVARAPAAFFWIMPTADARERAVRWLRAQGIPCSEADCYVAPKYGSGPMEDWNLLHAIRSRRPKHVVIAIGGGTQERLGLFLKLKLDYRPGIHCIGAAIGFLIGDQVRIPRWADSLFLGWLFRCISEPTRFVPRYWRARKLVAMMWRYRDRLPEIAA